ncbi:asparaginase [Streptomyces sp. adm13(2018)]|uniref:asparaginase n=1 Tax=Streptomyces sp. adm13(2018) TaxID=2479007 RepID=UPI0011CE1C50|nr:asparaginase [Streptomyces sp. adm13(2018)]TXS14344.1 asparaginase [Streptomyces sp. adm13(2018)]
MKRTNDGGARRIVVISTGGTIASRWQGTGYAADASGDDVLATAPLPEGVTVEVVDLFNVNSSRMTAAHQLALLRTVHETLADPGVDGIVITHGTDTLEETAFFLDLHHTDARPVVLTGAQRPFGTGDGDGPGNLYDALQVASSVSDLGVLVVFDGRVHAARGTVKTQTLAADAFSDPSADRLGRVGFSRVDIERQPERPTPLPLPAAADKADPDLPGAVALPRVAIVAHHSDGDPFLLNAAVDAGARGIVLVATGAGNATPEIVSAVADAVAQGVLVAVTTRVPAGPLAEIYTGGGAVDLVAAGALLTGTLRAAQARIAVLATLLAEDGHGAGDPARGTALLRRLLDGPVRAEPGLATGGSRSASAVAARA